MQFLNAIKHNKQGKHQLEDNGKPAGNAHILVSFMKHNASGSIYRMSSGITTKTIRNAFTQGQADCFSSIFSVSLNYGSTELMFYAPLDTKYVISETVPKPISALYEETKPSTTPIKQNVLQHKINTKN